MNYNKGNKIIVSDLVFVVKLQCIFFGLCGKDESMVMLFVVFGFTNCICAMMEYEDIRHFYQRFTMGQF